MKNLNQLIQTFQKAVKGTFLEEDRNSNFLNENTIPKTQHFNATNQVQTDE